MLSEEEIIDKVMMIDQWKVSGDIYTQNELNAIGELLDLYNKEKEKNKELRKPKYIMDFKTNKITKLANDFVSKDKIKELIDKRGNNGYTSLDCIEDIKELLEERS